MNTPTTLKPVSKKALQETAIAVGTPRRRGGSRGLFETIVLKALSRMRRGKLRVTLPDGREVFLGDPAAGESATLRIMDPAFFKKCVLFGDVGFGEAYVDGDWETDDIAAVIRWLIVNLEDAPGLSGSKAGAGLTNLLIAFNRVVHLLRPNSVRKSRSNIHEHYDLGNDFYQLFLDETMTYSSGLFRSGDESLAEAQEAKYKRLCDQLRLKQSDHVLEIGCGWGGFCTYAAKHYGCRVTAITISEEQLKYARERVAREGLAGRVDIVLRDYRHVIGEFDKIVSIEMLEAVGDGYLETYFAKCFEVLKKDGLLGVQMITCPDSRFDQLRKGVDWIQKHIFPGSLLLSVGRVNRALNRTGDLFLHDLKDMGDSYMRTLGIWRERFNAELPAVRKLGFDESFVRKWNYYLSYCEAAFDMRNISVVQAIYTRPNNLALAEARQALS
ncbi:MAG: class I SAM-dependent methyltransferase [Verrucomicrobiia bacterium]|jgi:cyclopropane-fatty-acyl-phospholipid synthase